MSKVYEFLANGFEEIEALAPVDILRRGGQEVMTVSVTGSEWVESSHGVTIKADMLFEDADLSDADLLLLPGGMPGSANLNQHEGVRQALLAHNDKGRLIGAICAAPMVLGGLGLLQGRRATCSPGFEVYLEGADYTHELCTVDGNIITGEGPAASLPYAYQLLTILTNDEVSTRQLQHKMQFLHLIGEE
ncbi:MAG: DJ-1/PfpI family protein [Prevotella sp.]|nr:DJ-1/PfpI family protein [Prevotella sp.]